MTMKKKEEELKPDNHEDQTFIRLLQLAGTRPVVPNEVRARVRSNLHTQWKKTTRIRLWRKRFFYGLAAAAVVLFLYDASLWLIGRDLPTSVPVGFVENRTGTVLAIQETSGENRSQALTRGEPVLSHSWLESGDSGRVLVHLLNGATLRLDVNTRFRLESEASFVLDHGTVYIDSEGTGAKLSLSTAHGTIRNLGTQFEVSVDPAGIRIRVREGAIILQRYGSQETAAAGTQLSYSKDGKFSRIALASYSPSYSWLSEIGPTYHLEGSSLTEFLSWMARENGWRVEYKDSGIQRNAPGIILHGSVQGLRPEEMPSVVLPVCGLTYQLEDGILNLDRAR